MRTKHLQLTREQFNAIVKTTNFNDETKALLWDYMTSEELTQAELAEKHGVTQGRIHHVLKRFQEQMTRLVKRKNLTCVTLFVAPEDMPVARQIDAFSRSRKTTRSDKSKALV